MFERLCGLILWLYAVFCLAGLMIGFARLTGCSPAEGAPAPLARREPRPVTPWRIEGVWEGRTSYGRGLFRCEFHEGGGYVESYNGRPYVGRWEMVEGAPIATCWREADPSRQIVQRYDREGATIRCHLTGPLVRVK
jgi:hypothetical protein